MGDRGAVRTSDAERERVARDLAEHAAAGRIDLDELDERLAVAYEARTKDELQAVTSDLPRQARNKAPAGKRRRRGPGNPFDSPFKVNLDLDAPREQVYDWGLTSLAPAMSAEGFRLVASERPHQLQFVHTRAPHWAPLAALFTAGVGLVAFLIRVERQVSFILVDNPEGGTRLIVFGEAPGWTRQRVKELLGSR